MRKYQNIRAAAQVIFSRTAVMVLMAALILILMTACCIGLDMAHADEEETTYTIFVYSGQEGYFGNETETVKKIIGLKYGESVVLDLKDFDLKVRDQKKYYVRGLKIAGHDNDQLSTMQFQSYSFRVKEDVAFSVAYGMAGGMVKYTVKYVDEEGNPLHDDEEFYGMPGDMPVVAYRRIQGYLPDDYNLTKTLTDNEGDNVFTFTYHAVASSDENSGDENGAGDEGDQDADGNGANGADGTGNNAGNGAFGSGNFQGQNGGNPDDGNDGDIVNLDDNDVALSDGKNSGDNKNGAGAVNPVLAGAAAGAAFLVLLLSLLFKRRFKDKSSDEASI